jgi:hypothetical protein
MALYRLARIEAGLDAAGGIVDHGNEHHRLTPSLQPVVDRRVHLHQFTKALASRTALPMLLALPLALPKAARQQPAPQRVVRHPDSLLGQLLSRQGRPKAQVALLILAQHLLTQFRRQASIRGPTAQPVDQSLVALLF